MRWEVPIHLLEVLMFHQHGRMTVPLQASRQAEMLLREIKVMIEKGVANRHLQQIPHIVLLSKQFYHGELKPLLARWLVMFLAMRRPSGLTDDQMLAYLMLPKDPADEVTPTEAEGGETQEWLNEQVARRKKFVPRVEVCGIRPELLSDESTKLLNLCHDWLHCFFPFILAKIHRVSFGVLSDVEVREAHENGVKMPKSRELMAVPFVGKDVPSAKSEFAHPDCLIGLTLNAYRYQGLRRSDFKKFLRSLQESLYEEVGPYNGRPSSQLFTQFVKLAGGHVRGSTLEQAAVRLKKKQQLKQDEAHIQQLLEAQWEYQRLQLEVRQQRKASSMASIADVTAATSNKLPTSASMNHGPTPVNTSDDSKEEKSSLMTPSKPKLNTMIHTTQRSYASGNEVWPLRLIDVEDEEQFTLVFNLLHNLPELVYYYLRNYIFPQTLRHQGLKLSASGQDVGGDIIADHRVGFSGTPSSLLPLEMGECQYEKGSDGSMIHTLTDTKICQVQFIPSNWRVKSLLDTIAQGRYHALIDTGALITGLSNLEVAQYLLENGLPDTEGVVFLDEGDRKMILLRRSKKVIPLSACGIPLHKRFASVKR